MAIPARSCLSRLVSVGRAAFGDVRASDEAIADALGDREVELRCAADVFLAAAVLAGDAAALRTLDQLLADVAPALRGVVRDHEIDELVQELRVRAVVGQPDRPAALATYTGRGPLRAWLRVTLLRAGLDRRRRVADVQLDEAAWLAIPADAIDPGIAELRRLAGDHVRTALERSIAELSSRERLILRQHLIDGLTPPDLATLYGVHRVTAFRWLAAIRQRVLADVRATLSRELALEPEALDSLLRTLRGSLVPTVERVLVMTPDPS